jgi:colicin import membrane protein
VFLVIQQHTIFWRPALLSLLFHGLVLAAVTLKWAPGREQAPVARVQPKHIEARLIDASALKPMKKKVAAPKPATTARKQPAQKTVTRSGNAAPKPAPSKPRTEPRTEPKPMPVPVPATGSTAEQQRALAQEELALAIDAEDMLLEQASDEDMAQSYVALISRTVQNNWSRPPSARNGMEAELIIQLIPTGEVVSVTVARSSGLLAFDRSAVNAVQKSERFPELQQLPSRVFENSFRQFRLLFKPEDLRY